MTNNKKSASAAATVQGAKQKVFRNENNTVSGKAQDLWRVICDLDYCEIEFEQERDAFSLLLEDLDDSVHGSNLGRALVDISALNLAYEAFCNSLENYQKLIRTAYNRYRLEVPRED